MCITHTIGGGVCVHSAHPPDFRRDWAAEHRLLQASADRHLQPRAALRFWHCTSCYLALPGHKGRNCPEDKNEPNRLEP